MIKRFLTLLFCLASPAIFAASKYYQIEVLIFSHITAETLSQENWPTIPSVDNPLIDDNEENSGIKTVNPSDFILKKEAAALSKKANYQILYHAAWMASAATLSQKKTIYIQTDPNALNDAEINGSFSISLNRYFNTHFQLYLNEPTSKLRRLSDNTAFSNAPDIFHFSLNQKRRMRSRELNFLSHPLFGVLIKIIPVKPK